MSEHRCAPPRGDESQPGQIWTCPGTRCRRQWRAAQWGPAINWSMTGHTTPVVTAPPEVPARTAHRGEIPSGASKLAALANARGWRVRITYARGTYVTTQSRVVDSIAVRMCSGLRWATAIWLNGRFSTAIHGAPGEGPVTCVLRDLTAWLEGAP